MAILDKIKTIRDTLVIEKTGYDERNDYYYWKADDVAAAVRKEMNKVGVIHRVETLDVLDGNRVDAQGRDRSRITLHNRVVFIDPDDGSEYAVDAVGTGSDIGATSTPARPPSRRSRSRALTRSWSQRAWRSWTATATPRLSRKT